MILTRFAMFDDRVIGRLDHDGVTFYTIERPWLDNKPFVSCIPCGDYIMRRFSDLHGRRSSKDVGGEDVWEICDVDGRTFVLIHVANRSRNVLGCIGLGTTLYENVQGVGNSRKAIQRFYARTAQETTLPLTIRQGFLNVA